MFAERFGLTGMGGGGTGESRVKRARCRLLSMVSSSVRALESEVMALDAGSRRRGRRVKVSGSSILEFPEIEVVQGFCLYCVVFAVSIKEQFYCGLVF